MAPTWNCDRTTWPWTGPCQRDFLWLILAFSLSCSRFLLHENVHALSLHHHGLLNFRLIQRLIEESVAMGNVLKSSNIYMIFIGKETRYNSSLVGTVGWLWIPSKFEKLFGFCSFTQITGKWDYLLIHINYNYVSLLFDQETTTICINFYHIISVLLSF